MQFTMNWALQLDLSDMLTVWDTFLFEKLWNRVYPLNKSIDLLNQDRQAIAKVSIKQFTNSLWKTSGEYKVLEIYTGKKQQERSNYWNEEAHFE